MQHLPRPLNTLQSLIFPGFLENKFSLPIMRGIALAEKHPIILKMIEADQNTHALRKKEVRHRDKVWLIENGSSCLFGEDEDEEGVVELSSTRGRYRMPPIVVFIFFLVRGYLGGIKDSKCYAFIQESKFIEATLAHFGIGKIPGASTILDNLNLLSESTLIAIHKLTIEESLILGLDDFKKLYFDSTRISASSAWPTEGRTIADLLSRVRTGFDIFKDYDIKINLPAETDNLIESVHSSKTSIALTAGRKGSKKHIKKMYRKILRECRILLRSFQAGLNRATGKIGNILPSIKAGLEGLAEHISVDLHNIELCAKNAKLRVLENKQVSASQKVLGIADADAEIIPKGTRPLIFGYKPQIGRSEQGFIVGVLVPQGAAADSDQMKPLTDASIGNTGVVPDVLSYDDGYTNSKSREAYLAQGIDVVSFSGAKGRAQTENEWDRPDYIEARNKRSMAESTMSVLKGFFDLGRFSRRGRENVTAELLTAAIFHNIALIQKRE